MAVASGSPSDSRELIQTVRGVGYRIDGIDIALAQADRLLATLIETYEPVAIDAGHSLRATLADDAHTEGDGELFANLIENAIIRTPAGTEVSITVARSPGETVVTVSDDGPGVPGRSRGKRRLKHPARRCGFWRSMTSPTIERRGVPGDIAPDINPSHKSTNWSDERGEAPCIYSLSKTIRSSRIISFPD